VPEANITALSGGEVVEGFRVEYTPGHASHHVCYLHQASGDAYVGDVAGVRIPPAEYTVAPTPPPDIDLTAWRSSLEVVDSWDPAALCLTHFGRYEDVTSQLDRVRAALEEWGEVARRGDSESFQDAVERERREAVDHETADRYERAVPQDQMWLGLERYWRKRPDATAEQAAAEAG
jgi:glyoxylase-like metal-dependent hydrolase (beta-lactamase superfamily II)